MESLVSAISLKYVFVETITKQTVKLLELQFGQKATFSNIRFQKPVLY